MFFIFGINSNVIKSFGHSKNINKKCIKCNRLDDKELIRISSYITFFFIPIVPISRKYFVFCTNCNHAELLSKEDFTNMLNDKREESVYGLLDLNKKEENQYEGKTKTQIAYLKGLEEFEKENKDNA